MAKVSPIALSKTVRHLGAAEELSSVSIGNVTRALADRDTEIAAKLNELVRQEASSNQLQYVPLPRFSLEAKKTAYLSNIRIPQGYEATVLNVSVGPAGDGSLKAIVIHSPGTFGQLGAGEGAATLIETTSEYSEGGEYVSVGELVIAVENLSDFRVSGAVSVLLGLREKA